MQDTSRLEQKIDDQNGKIDKLIETMTTFVAFQARAEERHNNANQRFEKIDQRFEKYEKKIDEFRDDLNTAWDLAKKNALISNGVTAVAMLIIGVAIKTYIGG